MELSVYYDTEKHRHSLMHQGAYRRYPLASLHLLRAYNALEAETGNYGAINLTTISLRFVSQWGSSWPDPNIMCVAMCSASLFTTCLWWTGEGQLPTANLIFTVY